MYLCQICHQCVPPRTKAYRIPVETRRRRYPPRTEVNEVVRGGKRRYTDDPGGEGYEIVREVIACPGCATRYGVEV
jgi:hypothetical protein